MAICVRPKPVVIAESGPEPVTPGKMPETVPDDKTAEKSAAIGSGKVAEAATDDETEKSKGTAVTPQALYLVIAAVVIVVGGFGGTLIHDHWARAVSFVPPQGIGIFALFYIIAQLIERVQEPFVPYLGRAKDPGEKKEKQKEGKRAHFKNQLRAKAERDKAVVAELRLPENGSGQPTLEKNVANKERCVDQIRANLTVLIFATSALLAMIISGYLRAGLLRTVGESGIPAWVDIAVTGLVIGAGTKPLHDLISNISASKAEKQKPPGVP
jgi:hypothetical protein